MQVELPNGSIAYTALEAKEVAYAAYNTAYQQWVESQYEYFVQELATETIEHHAALLRKLGLDIETQDMVFCMDGKYLYAPIEYRYVKGWRELPEAAQITQAMECRLNDLAYCQRRFFYSLRMGMNPHPNWARDIHCATEVEHLDDWELSKESVLFLEQAFRETCASITAEIMDIVSCDWDYQSSEEQFLESCDAMDYWITKDGGMIWNIEEHFNDD